MVKAELIEAAALNSHSEAVELVRMRRSSNGRWYLKLKIKVKAELVDGRIINVESEQEVRTKQYGSRHNKGHRLRAPTVIIPERSSR